MRSLSAGRMHHRAGHRMFAAAALSAMLVLSGCMKPGEKSTAQGDPLDDASPIVAQLRVAPDALPAGTALDAVANHLIAAETRAAEAQLRSAQLKADAQAKAWLPGITPGASLTDMGVLTASLLAEMVLFDNGRFKADKAAARSEVDKAVVELAQDLNDRVYEAAALYLGLREAAGQVAAADRSIARLRDLERIARLRAEGGVADSSDHILIGLKIHDIHTQRDLDQQQASNQRAQLAQMIGTDITALPKEIAVAPLPVDTAALPVLKAEAEADIARAQAKSQKASLFPALTAGAALSQDGVVNGALSASTGQKIGFGTGDQMRAYDADAEAAVLKLDETRRDTERALAAKRRQAQTLAAQDGQLASLAGQARQNLKLYQEQFEVGQRGLMDIVTVHETLLGTERKRIAARFEQLRTELDVARLVGALTGGGVF